MTVCRGCGMELGDVEIDICKTCCKASARAHIRRTNRQHLIASLESSDDAEP